MTKISVRKAHKWMAVAASIFLLAWLVSGLVMVIPFDWLARKVGLAAAPVASSRPLDFRQITVTIPEAISALEAELGGPADVTQVRVTAFRDRPAYQLNVAGGSVHLVDAVTGTPIVVSEALAEELATRALPGPARVAATVRVERPDYYFWGPFPAHKVVFEDPPGNVVYVSATGIVRRSTKASRLRRWVTSLHGFEPLWLIHDSRRFRVAASVLPTGLALFVVVSGLLLAWPSRRRRRPATTDPVE